MELRKDTTERELGKHMHRCRICGSEGIFQSYLVREMMWDTREEFEYFECAECGCLQIAEIPDNLEKYYREEYYSFQRMDQEERIFEHPVRHFERILDVGCGSGEWLLALADKGYGCLSGCDPYLKTDIRYGDRVNIRNCTIHEMPGDGSYDLITMHDSFEHMTDPLEVMVSAKRLLKSDGVLEIHVPTYPNKAFDIYGPHWFQLDAPRHITLHTIESLAYLAVMSGMVLTQREYDSNYRQFIYSFFYQHNISIHNITRELIQEYFPLEKRAELVALSNECNHNCQGDHMIVRLKKDQDL